MKKEDSSTGHGEASHSSSRARSRVYAELISDKDRVKSDEVVNLNLKVHVQGPVRSSLNQEAWTDAYEKHDVSFLLRFYLKLVRKRGPLGKEILKSYLRRKGKFYWSRDPQRHNQTWIMTVDELGNPSIARNEEEARSALFDLIKNLQLLGSDIGKGRCRLMAEVKVKWGKHTFMSPGTISCKSNSIYLSIS
jgi:hypothetical protein